MRIVSASIHDTPSFVKLITKNRLTDEEMDKVQNILKDNFDKVVRQQCLIYREMNCKESFCIPDFIVSNDKEVIAIDCKRIPCTEKKLSQYKNILQYILWEHGDTRNVSATHLFTLLPDFNL